MTEHFHTCSKKGRGMARASLDLIAAMHAIAEAAQPITGRGVGYKLFTSTRIPSMATNEMQRVYRLLKEARERGIIPWQWIVDEGRAIERVSTWDDPAEYARAVAQSYRRDFWNQQPVRIIVVSEKGTVRGLLKPVLDRFAVGFLPVHGFSSATTVYEPFPRQRWPTIHRTLCRRLRSERHVHVGGRLTQPILQIRRRSRRASPHRADTTAVDRTSVFPRLRQTQRLALPMVRPQLR
jgi:hypothetical protein